MTADAFKTDVELLVFSRWLIPGYPEGLVLENHALAVLNGRIRAIVPAAEANSAMNATETLHLPDHIVMPGLINAHGHAAMSLLRGYADDKPLMTWLNDHIWPAEAAHVDATFVADGVLLALAEMVRGGTTCFSDMYFFPDVTAALADEYGLRAQIAFPIFDFPTVWGSGPDEYIDKGIALREEYLNHPRVQPVFGPHAPYTVAEPALQRIAELAEQLACPVHIHVQETAAEVSDSLAQYQTTPLSRLRDLGLLSAKTQCVHMTQLCEGDLQLLQEHRAHVIHCPGSNMKLASGTCPVTKFDGAGINVGLGTDSAASNNRLDMFWEMRTAALLAKLSSQDASALPAAKVVSMVTLQGARALGIEKETGSLEVGKAADFIAIDTNQPGCQPVYDPISHLVYATNSEQVSHNYVAGRCLLSDGVLTELPRSSIMAAAHKWQKHITDQEISEVP